MSLMAASALIVAGAFFVLVAAIGVVRLPDLFMRMHAATKAGALGTGLLLLSVAFIHGEWHVTLRVIAAITFLFLTAPVAAHAIGRAAYLAGEVQLWEGTFVDELREVVDRARAAEADVARGRAEEAAVEAAPPTQKSAEGPSGPASPGAAGSTGPGSGG
jgi:multicomponent Na+:H+ antiporter subunit G